MGLGAKFWETAQRLEYSAYRERRRRRLRVTDFTIIATNCIGTMMYHDLGLEFRTPTVNLTISMPDLVKAAGNLRWYMAQELVECVQLGGDMGCPVGLLGDVQVNFVHYDTFGEAAEKWNQRRRRINWDRIILMGSDRSLCDYKTLRAFDNLPWPNKVVFTHVDYPEFQSAYHITGFEGGLELGNVLLYRPQRRKRRYMDQFDYVSFLNKTVRTAGLEGGAYGSGGNSQ